MSWYPIALSDGEGQNYYFFFKSKHNSSACHRPNVLIITQATVCAVVDTTQGLLWLRKTQDSREAVQDKSEVSQDFGISSGKGKQLEKWNKGCSQCHFCKGTGVSSTLNQTFLTVTTLYTPSQLENGSLAPLKPYRALKGKLQRIHSVSNACSSLLKLRSSRNCKQAESKGEKNNFCFGLESKQHEIAAMPNTALWPLPSNYCRNTLKTRAVTQFCNKMLVLFSLSVWITLSIPTC